MGWRDLACYGSTFYVTPNIDRLAAQSRFPQRLVEALLKTLCAPEWPSASSQTPHSRSNMNFIAMSSFHE